MQSTGLLHCFPVCISADCAVLLQIHKELVQSQEEISEALHQKFMAMLLAMEDVPAVLIVLADQLHLMRTQPSPDAAQDTLYVFAPLANRLGVWSMKAELEDLAFKVMPTPQNEKILALFILGATQWPYT